MFILLGPKEKIEKYSRPRFCSNSIIILLIVFVVILPLLSITSLLLLLFNNNTADAQNVMAVTTTIPPVNRNVNNNMSEVSYFTRWNDPTENAFTVLIPKGWTVHPYLGSNSGVIRSLNGLNNADFIFNVTDPAARDQIFFANSGIYYVEPNPASGLNEGSVYPGSNSNTPNVYYYRNAVDYVKEFVLPFLQTKYPDAQILTIKNISSSRPLQQQEQNSPAAANLTTAASALFSYTSNGGEQYLAGVDVITGGRGVWYATVLGTSAIKSQFHNVSNLAQMVLMSPRINKEWAIAEIHGIEARTNIILNEQEAIANIINQHKPSGLDPKLSQAWSDTILGSSDWVSKTGDTYNLPNDFQHYWVDPSQNIAASNTNTSPGPEFTPLSPANGSRQ
ncbi:MAG: hypothetical protein JO297_00110 [Nitrososphaeraceae archaeon]|nr:hypothetical protein [Nitrososphaeraceae archaeon]